MNLNNIRWIVIGIFSWLLIEELNTIISVFFRYLLIYIKVSPQLNFSFTTVLSTIVMLGFFYLILKFYKLSIENNRKLLIKVFYYFIIITVLSYFIFDILNSCFGGYEFSENVNKYIDFIETNYLLKTIQVIKNFSILIIVFLIVYLKKDKIDGLNNN
jgi:hypothetical protein